MIIRVVLLIALLSSLAIACDCNIPTFQTSLAESDVVFRGTITNFRQGPKEVSITEEPTHRLAVFQVSRVWKGRVEQIFEMPAVPETAACWGFWPSHLKLGNDLLVYGRRMAGEYYTSICFRTALAKDSHDFEALGPGEAPKSPARFSEQERVRLKEWIALRFLGTFTALYLYWFISKKNFQT